MPGVTISAGYGAGGNVVATQVANRLGMTLLDRAISSTVAAQLRVSVAEAEEGEPKRSTAERFFSLLRPLAGGVLGVGIDAAPDLQQIPEESEVFRMQAEAIMRAALPDGAVILGRAGAAALRDEDDVLKVRLFGPDEACARHAARIQHISIESARVQLREVNQARKHYVQRLYHVDIDDPSLFDLQIDSTSIALQACAELITTAYQGLERPARPDGESPARS